MLKSTATTTTTLSAINRLLCVSLYEKYNNINLLPVMTIRSILRKKAGFSGKLDKEHVPAAIETIMKHQIYDWEFSYEYGRKQKLKVENFDKADGLAVALAFAIKENAI